MPLTKRHHNLLPRTASVRTTPTAEHQEGDDGWYQAGIPGTRFADNGDGTVTDFHTSLMWVKTPHLIIPGAVTGISENTVQRVGPDHGSGLGVWVTGSAYLAGDVVTDGATFAVAPANYTSGGAYATDVSGGDLRTTVWIGSSANLTTASTDTWGNTLTNVQALDFVYTDWRMPNMFEVISLYDGDNFSSPNMHSPFVVTSDNRFWTSTTRRSTATHAMYVQFANNFPVNSELKSESNPSMIVRGGRFLER